MTGLFFTLIKIAVGNLTVSDGLSCAPSEAEWKEALITANKQTMIGVLLPAVEEVNKVYPVPRSIWIQWNFFTQKIIEKNRMMDQKVIEISNILSDAGFHYCVMKGQAIARYYPRPELRSPGDIDIWMADEKDIVSNASLTKRRKTIVKYVHSRFPYEEVVYHHMDFPIFKSEKIPVELHYTPSYMLCPTTNAILQKFFIDSAEAQFDNTIRFVNDTNIHTPATSFNRIYLLLHIYRHFFDEGIGLRQLMDYYYVLREHEPSQEDCKFIAEAIRQFRMERFAKATMYVLTTIFGLEKQYLFTDQDISEGAFLLDEIIQSGNFGQFDERMHRKHTRTNKFIRKTRRNLRFLTNYTREVVFDIPFRVGQFTWRLINGYL